MATAPVEPVHELTENAEKKHIQGQPGVEFLKVVKRVHEDHDKKILRYNQRIAKFQEQDHTVQSTFEMLEMDQKDRKESRKKWEERYQELLEDNQAKRKELEQRFLKHLESQKRFEHDQAQLQARLLETRGFDLHSLVGLLHRLCENTLDELQDARNILTKILSLRVCRSSTFRVKRTGEIDLNLWMEACERLNQDSQMHGGSKDVFEAKFHKWRDSIIDPRLGNPFKRVKLENDKWQLDIENDADLQTLKTELGNEVLQIVVSALQEIELYNPSEYYSIPIMWNCRKRERATLSEVLTHLLHVLETLENEKRESYAGEQI